MVLIVTVEEMKIVFFIVGLFILFLIGLGANYQLNNQVLISKTNSVNIDGSSTPYIPSNQKKSVKRPSQLKPNRLVKRMSERMRIIQRIYRRKLPIKQNNTEKSNEKDKMKVIDTKQGNLYFIFTGRNIKSN